jgi:putative ABC transport system permease protein
MRPEHWMFTIPLRLRSLFQSAQADQELDDELRDHLERKTQEYVAQGVTQEEAHRRARLDLGGIEQTKEKCRDARRVNWIQDFVQDLHVGLRLLHKSAGFTVVAIVTLALGIGATTAIFSIVNAVLLSPLPFPEPDRLVRITFSEPGLGLRDVPFSVPEFDDLRNRAGVFTDVSTIASNSVNLTGADHPERLEFLVTHSNYFSMLGVTPQIGRLFGPQDFALGFAPVTVISDGLWRRSYGADPKVIGRTVRLDGDSYAIVGVLPPEFRHPGPTVSGNVEVFQTAGFSGDPAPPPARSTRIMPRAIGRLKPGITVEQAQARLTAMATQICHDYPADYPPQDQWTIEIQPLQEALVGNVRPMLLVLLGAVILIVFIVSLNIANLLLARASARQQEMAVRCALGATHGRMIRQMLTESMLLSVIGGAAGVLTTVGTIGFLLRLVPSNIPRLNEVRIDWLVLAFALAISVLTGLAFGLAPALQSAKGALSSAIREGARGSGSSANTGRLRDALIVSELAFAVVLMVAAGLLLRTLRGLLQENPGFNPTQVVAANLPLPEPNDPKADPYLSLAQQTSFNRELLRRMGAIPGIELAAITSDLPTTDLRLTDAQGINALAIEDDPLESSLDLRAERIRISPDYFKVMQTPLLRGRFFTDGDEDGKQPVAIIDETTARKYWPNRDPLGRMLRFGQSLTQPRMTVVGIVRDIKNDGLDTAGVPHIYVPIYQSLDRDLSVVLRTSLPAKILEPQIRQEVQSIDPGLPVFNVSSMNDVLDRSLASRRFSAELVGAFAGVALLLASIGIYGLLAYMVGQRSREIGIRMALGARRWDVLKLILGKGLVLASVGIVAGAIVSAATASMMASLLYGVHPHDLLVFLTVPLLLFAVAVLASYLPARRATKVDPIVALRET